MDLALRHVRGREYELIPKSLVIALEMIVGHEFSHSFSQVSFAEDNHSV